MTEAALRVESLSKVFDWETLLLAVVFATAFFAATHWFWRFALRRYSA
jgi:ABC-type uncharacterized transport system permease subunit